VDGKLVRIAGNPLHPMSRGGVCPGGIAGVQVLYHPRRIRGPLIRSGSRGGGEWREATIAEALEVVGERLSTLRAEGRTDELALVKGYCAGTMEDLWQHFFRAFGSPNVVSEGPDDGTALLMALMHGMTVRPGYDLERSDFILSVGAPLFESWWSPVQAYVAFASPDGIDEVSSRLVQVDTRFSRTAARAHEWVGIRPGTHGVLALGLAYVLVRDELYDESFVAEHVTGFEDFRDDRGREVEGYRSIVMRHYRTEEVSAVTGVPVERITALARAFADSRSPVAVCGPDVMNAPNGLECGLAVHSLNVIMGRINREGGVVTQESIPLDPLVEPVLDRVSQQGVGRASVQDAPPPFGVGEEALRFASSIARGTTSQIDTLLLYYANPLAASPRPDTWRTVLAKVPFVVSFSPFLDETTQHADVVLPDLLPYERWQDAPAPPSYPYPVWGISRPLVTPHSHAIHSGDAILELARSVGDSVAQSLPYKNFESLLKVRARGLYAARHGMTLGDAFEQRHHRQMEERGWWLPGHAAFDPFWEELVDRGGWADLVYDETDPARLSRLPGGRIDLMPAPVRRVVTDRQLYLDVRPAVPPSSEEFPLRLLPYRVSALSPGTLALETWLAEQPTPLPDVQWYPWVEVHPETARDLGIADGTDVWVVSPRGRYRARLRWYPGMARDNVGAPYGLKHPSGELANPLQLLEGSRDPLTGRRSWFTTFIRVEPAQGGGR
jgi:anaerobic selenocysteine-containing dehydrogenase